MLLIFLYQALAVLVVILASLLLRQGHISASSGAVAELGLAFPAGSPWTILSIHLI